MPSQYYKMKQNSWYVWNTFLNTLFKRFFNRYWIFAIINISIISYRYLYLLQELHSNYISLLLCNVISTLNEFFLVLHGFFSLYGEFIIFEICLIFLVYQWLSNKRTYLPKKTLYVNEDQMFYVQLWSFRICTNLGLACVTT